MKFDLNDFLRFSFQNGLHGKSIDQLVKALSPNLSATATKVNVRLDSQVEFGKMIKDADDTFIALEAEIPLCALYLPDQNCPVSRIYYILPKDHNELLEFLEYLNGSGFQANQLLDQASFNKKIQAEDAAIRIDNYMKEHTDPMQRKAMELAQGRSQNTIVGQTEYFQTDGCFICREKVVQLISATIATDTAQSMQFLLCDKHSKEALSSDSVLNYIARNVGLKPPIDVAPLDLKTNKEYFQEAEALIKDNLGCDIEKVSHSDRTITAVRRESGLRVIIRLHSEQKPGYAYMLNLPEGPQVSRIDEAPDHPDVDFFPDHRHTTLPKNNKYAVPSFTTGHIRLDLPAIIEEIVRIESSLPKE